MATRPLAGGRGLRELAGRPLSSVAALPVAWRCCLLVLSILATRLPLRTRYLANWDADQFALGLTNFDVVHHQPHPPGYLGYLLLGHAVLPLTGDPNAALVSLSVAGQAIALVLLYLWGRSLFGELAALLSALAFGLSPLAWYYAEIANTYALEPALVLGIAWAAWACWRRDRRAAMPLGAILGLAGAIRPSTAFLMAPLALVAIVRLGDRWLGARAAGIAGALTASWVIPLLVLTGGPRRYLAAASALSADVTSSTAIWRAGLAGLRLTATAVAGGTVWELGGFTILLLFGVVAPFVTGGRAHIAIPAGWPAFAALWALPGLATFLFVHIGQLVYVQQFTPLLFLLAGPAALATAKALGSERWAVPLALLAGVASLALFMLPARVSLAGQLTAHDRWVAAVRAALAGDDPDTTLLITDAYAVGSYRTAQVYLPDLHRVALGEDRQGRLGEIYGDVYTPTNFESARPLALPAATTTLVFLDRPVVERFVGDADLMRRVDLAGGEPLYVWALPAGEAPVIRGNRIWLGDHAGFLERRGLLG